MLMKVTRKRLYYYDHIGLLKPTKRLGPQQAKQYNAKAIERLGIILALQEAGLKIKEIQAMIDSPVVHQIEMLEEVCTRLYGEKDTLDQQIHRIEELLETLRNASKEQQGNTLQGG